MKTRHAVLSALPNAAMSVRNAYSKLQWSGSDSRNPKLRSVDEHGVLWLRDVKQLVNDLYDHFEKDGPPLPVNLEEEINSLRREVVVNINGEEYIHVGDIKALLKNLVPSLFEED